MIGLTRGASRQLTRLLVGVGVTATLACSDDVTAPAEAGQDSESEAESGPETSGGVDTGTSGAETDTDTDTGAETDTDTGTDTEPDPDPAQIQITEIMYHPVLEEDYVDHHEFIELHNPGVDPVWLDGWTLSGGLDYEFPADTVIEPGAYLVVARDPAALLAVQAYGLDAADVVGPYARELDNGEDSIALRRDDFSYADGLTYDDGFPWPIAADALGAGESWLAPELLPLEDHRYRGVSLERISLSVYTADVANWAPSAVDQATPGRAYAGAVDEPPPILLSKATSTDSQEPLIRAGEAVTLELEFSTYGSLSDVHLEYFVDDVQVQGEPIVSIDVPDEDFVGRTVSVELPGQPDESIVRWRVFGDRGAGVEQISPRPSDPHPYHAYFVSPVVDTDQTLYQLYLSSTNWTQMWQNVAQGREIGCEANPTWNDRVFGVFIHEGEVYDVQVRYQGSRWNRRNGPAINNWPYPGPYMPTPIRGLSYRIAFPRYNRFEGERSVVTLNKLTQGCPGLSAAVGFELFRRAGIPSPQTEFVRFHINGGYYRYMLEIERPGDEMMAAYHEATAPDPDSVEPVGHLYKSVGLNADAGPYGWGDGRPLADSCGHAAYERYTYTYDRKTNTWETHDPLIAMFEALDSYRDPFSGAIDEIATQGYLEANFDVDMVLDHIAIMNWSVPFDDYFQNHFLYQRRSDDVWILMPWDLDLNFGPWANNTGSGAQASVFGGRNGQDAFGGIDANRAGWWNRVKDSFLRTYEDEYIDVIKFHAATTLHPDEVSAIVDDVVARYDFAEANIAASPPSCDIDAAAASFKAFAIARHDYVVNTPAQNLINW